MLEFRAWRAALVLAAVVALAACDQSPRNKAAAPPPPPVTVAKPVVKDIVEWDEFTGRFDASEAVDVRARVGGYLESVHFKDGALVRKGDLLFVIDPRPFKAALEEAAANVANAESRVEFATTDLRRTEALVKSGTAPERNLEERRQQFLSARAELARVKAARERAQLDLEFTEVRAPIAGRASRKLVSEGNLVTGGMSEATLLTTIVATDPIYFYFDVDERTYLGYARMAASGERLSSREYDYAVEVALADEQEFKHRGRMHFVDNRIDPATGTMRGRALFYNATHFLTPGLFGRIRIPGTGSYRGILLPDEAIVSDQDRRIVYVVAADGSVTPKPVRPGPRHDGYRVIRQGLEGDETVVINGLMRVRPGGKVKPELTVLPESR